MALREYRSVPIVTQLNVPTSASADRPARLWRLKGGLLGSPEMFMAGKASMLRNKGGFEFVPWCYSVKWGPMVPVHLGFAVLRIIYGRPEATITKEEVHEL
ncbi:MAG: hypothetical protein ACUVXI_17485 [bacterium]